MKFYSISVKLFSFRLKNTNKIRIGNKDMGPRKAIFNNKNSKNYLKIKISTI